MVKKQRKNYDVNFTNHMGVEVDASDLARDVDNVNRRNGKFISKDSDEYQENCRNAVEKGKDYLYGDGTEGSASQNYHDVKNSFGKINRDSLCVDEPYSDHVPEYDYQTDDKGRITKRRLY